MKSIKKQLEPIKLKEEEIHKSAGILDDFSIRKSTQVREATIGEGKITEDQETTDTAYIPMVLFNTDATPPTASDFPIGTIYIQYTA